MSAKETERTVLSHIVRDGACFSFCTESLEHSYFVRHKNRAPGCGSRERNGVEEAGTEGRIHGVRAKQRGRREGGRRTHQRSVRHAAAVARVLRSEE